jgi:hypothetical protein
MFKVGDEVIINKIHKKYGHSEIFLDISHNLWENKCFRIKKNRKKNLE